LGPLRKVYLRSVKTRTFSAPKTADKRHKAGGFYSLVQAAVVLPLKRDSGPEEGRVSRFFSSGFSPAVQALKVMQVLTDCFSAPVMLQYRLKVSDWKCSFEFSSADDNLRPLRYGKDKPFAEYRRRRGEGREIRNAG
jgi:hypothetical protein